MRRVTIRSLAILRDALLPKKLLSGELSVLDEKNKALEETHE